MGASGLLVQSVGMLWFWDGQWGKWGILARVITSCKGGQVWGKYKRKIGTKGKFALLWNTPNGLQAGLGHFVLCAYHSKMCHHSGFFRYCTSQPNGECRKEGKGLIPCSTSRPSPEITGAKPAEQWIRPPCLSRTGITRIRNLALSCAGMQGCRGKAWEVQPVTHLWVSGLCHYTQPICVVLQHHYWEQNMVPRTSSLS